MSGMLESRELAVLRWYLGQGLVLVALLGTTGIEVGAGPLVAAGLVLVLGSLLRPGLLERMPGPFWRISPFLLLAFIVGDFLLSRGDILPPLFRTVVLLSLYRSLQVRSPREDLQLLLLTLFLILFTGVLSLEITFGLQLLVYAPLAMGLLFFVNLTPGGTEAGIFRGLRWRPFLGRLRERLDRRTLMAGMLLYILTSGMTLLLFILLPRFDIGASLPFPRLHSARSLSGFTDHVRYGDVVSILNDETIAMRVDVEMTDPPARPYWRMVVLDAYYDGGFMVSPRVARAFRQVRHYRFDFEPMERLPGAVEGGWTLYLDGGVSSYLPTADAFSQLRFNNRIDLQLHDHTRVIRTRETSASTLSLRYEGLDFSGLVPASPKDLPLRSQPPLAVDTTDRRYLSRVGYPETLSVYPEGAGNQRILEQALAALGGIEGLPADAFARRLVSHLQDGRGYSLETRIPAGEADTLLRWLESGSAGHCELYAGAFVLISRYAGYPARLVTGFAGGDWNGYENYFMVRNRHAHAWCEIFDPRQGWLRIDPTPGNTTEAGSVDTALLGGGLFLDRTWKAYLDSLRILWYRRVIQFDGEDQVRMAEGVKGLSLRGMDWLKAGLARVREGLRRDWGAFVERGDWKGLVSGLAAPAGFVLLGGVVIFWIQRRRRRAGFEERMRGRAGRLLGALGDTAEAEAGRRRLLLVRYGPVDRWPADLTGLFKSIRRNPRCFRLSKGNS